MPKPTKPEIELAVAGQKAKASTYNDNMQSMLDYVDECMDYAVTADLSNLDTDGENHFDTKYVKKTNVANKGSATTPVYFNASGVATACTSIDSSLGGTIKAKYQDGSRGYVVYTNGYCVQWGFNSSATARNTSYEITLSKTYSDTNYNIILTPKHSGSTGSAKSWGVDNANSVEANKFYIISNAYGDPTTGGVYWETAGYLANGQY